MGRENYKTMREEKMNLNLNDTDKMFYSNYIKDFLPDKIIDVHTHVWLDEFKHRAADYEKKSRSVSWPSMVAKDNSIEDHLESYEIMFPEKLCIPMIFSNLFPGDDIEAGNGYISMCAGKYEIPSLMYTGPEAKPDDLEKKVLKGGFLGIKVYLNFAPYYIPQDEIRIYDYLTHEHLEVADKNGWIVMLHIPRKDRLKDPVNLIQMMEIDKRYKNIKLIIAHVGRAYCNEDVGDAFSVLKNSERMYFDISANCNAWVFEQLLKNVDTKKILFGSDLPILRMRTKRICENGKYVNLVPKGLYGDVSKDSHMREVSGEQSEKMTLFMYEEIKAFKLAANNIGLSDTDIEDVFFNNAKAILLSTGYNNIHFV